jgi:hypothetical protein
MQQPRINCTCPPRPISHRRMSQATNSHCTANSTTHDSAPIHHQWWCHVPTAHWHAMHIKRQSPVVARNHGVLCTHVGCHLGPPRAQHCTSTHSNRAHCWSWHIELEVCTLLGPSHNDQPWHTELEVCTLLGPSHIDAAHSATTKPHAVGPTAQLALLAAAFVSDPLEKCTQGSHTPSNKIGTCKVMLWSRAILNIA